MPYYVCGNNFRPAMKRVMIGSRFENVLGFCSFAMGKVPFFDLLGRCPECGGVGWILPGSEPLPLGFSTTNSHTPRPPEERTTSKSTELPRGYWEDWEDRVRPLKEKLEREAEEQRIQEEKLKKEEEKRRRKHLEQLELAKAEERRIFEERRREEDERRKIIEAQNQEAIALFRTYQAEENERKKEIAHRKKQVEEWKEEGLCKHCGHRKDFFGKCFSCSLFIIFKRRTITAVTPPLVHITFGDRKWRILAMKEDKVLILSETVIEYRSHHPFNHNEKDRINMTWENCELRYYLNVAFYKTFDSHERTLIVETPILNNDNLWYNTKGGNATLDKVFLLSLEEVDEYFGNSGDYEKKYRKSHKGKKKRRGRYVHNPYNKDRIALDAKGKICFWLLRSRGFHNGFFAGVHADGSISVDGNFFGDVGVRPALWLKCIT